MGFTPSLLQSFWFWFSFTTGFGFTIIGVIRQLWAAVAGYNAHAVQTRLRMLDVRQVALPAALAKVSHVQVRCPTHRIAQLSARLHRAFVRRRVGIDRVGSDLASRPMAAEVW